jgi:mannitol/fructose-specific phosphotransferase system IIA component (Ntr-type)
MLKQLLKNNIQVLENIDNWEEAIKYASIPLLEKKTIEDRYVRSMIENIYELGAYIVLMPRIAMPHSRSENGVNITSMSLLKLNKGVSFSKDKEDVNLIFILAAEDNTSHMDAIIELTDLLEDEKKIEQIIGAKNSEIIYNLI